MKISTKTDVGKQRKNNQDAFFAAEIGNKSAFVIVCDGMGGANAGNVASETAVKSISSYVMSSYSEKMDIVNIEKILNYAIENANMEIYDMALNNPTLTGMGTTVVAAFICGDVAVVSHVGDSRAYKITDEITQLTRDHSVVQNLIESGKITQADAKSHPKKNVITRALGVEKNIIADSVEVPLKKGEKLLLCTDGLTGYVDTTQILTAVNREQIDEAAEELISLANSAGGGDNITVAIVFR